MLNKRISQISSFFHDYFLWIVLAFYVIATFLPGWGQEIRNISFGNLTWFDNSSVQLSLPFLMLSFLLFNAGLGIKTEELKKLPSYLMVLLLGFAALIIVPILIIFMVHLGMMFWHDQEEVQNILVGLAVIASMPIASSSTAWAQNSDGNMALSIGLVVLSTLLSPFTAPLMLHFVGLLTYGDYSEDLHELASNGTGAFIIFSIIMPCLLGIIFHYLIGEEKIKHIKPGLKLTNSIILITLIYSNAALSLPNALLIEPDLDFLLIIFLITIVMCVIAFGSGYFISHVFKLDTSEEASIMYALGMKNNGGGLVLVSMALADHPLVMLPLIFYNLSQQVIASIVSKLETKTTDQ